jgi:predicted Zn-dependent protease
MRAYFDQIAAHADSLLQTGERYTAWFSGEESDFVRFNRSAIRQAGHVLQRELTINLIAGKTHAACKLALSGVLETDTALLGTSLSELRSQLAQLPEDPHLLIASEVTHSNYAPASQLPPSAAMVDQILAAAQGYDMVGILTAGSMVRGFANALGQRNWYETHTFNFDWSLFHQADKAVKNNYAGFAWDEQVLRDKFAQAAQRLALLSTPPVTVPPGDYRVFLSPAAMNELVGMLNWGGLAEKSLRTKRSALRRMQGGEARLHEMVDITEDNLAGLAPAFQAQGFIKPDKVALIRQGRMAGSMVSPRTAAEYGISGNGAGDDESANALCMRGGTLPSAQALAELGTGIYVANLWYLNFSDRASCRITGMTRFATFWVEDGKIKAPLNVMRFDDSLYRILGDNLLALTEETEIIMDDRSYGERRTGGAILPGALVKEMRFVL